MDDQLDNDLKNRIKEVFDKYEDTSADEGWLQLRKKYPEKAKRIIAAWVYWVPAAAVLLLFVGIFWLKTTPKQQQVAVTKTQRVHPPVKGAELKTNDNAARDSAALFQNNREIAQNSQQPGTTASNIGHKPNGVAVPTKGRQQYTLNHSQNVNPTVLKNPANPSLTNNASQANTIAQTNVQNTVTAPQKSEATTTVTPKNTIITPSNRQNEIIAKIDSGSKPPVISGAVKPTPNVNMTAQQPNNNSKQVFADNTNSYKKQKPLSGNKPLSFAVYTTTYVNYAKGSSHQFNVGGGFTTDIKLTNKLLFSTGMSVTQNTLSYAGQPPVQSATPTDFATSLAPASLSASRYAFTSNSSPAFRNYSANLVGLDIPLNIKFVIDPQKSATYLLAGLSSGTYINETYTYSYNNPSLFSANISQVQDQSTRSSFNGFYFAKTLNLAIGTGYMIGNSRLVVEPFLKYPLEGLGSQQLRFGAGGVNLKFNIQAFRK